ncbi:MAG: LamG domain-containing protein [Planctomycetes bacterium]|nr:LamG domain-containing protein [Planctomycetota bacterium]
MLPHSLSVVGFALFWSLTLTASLAAEGPVARWKLAGDLKDEVSGQTQAQNQGVQFTAGRAQFDGRGSHISLPVSPALKLGRTDFTLSVWVDKTDATDDDLGDILSQFDAAARTGFHLSLRNNAGVTHSQPNERQLQFGIDAGTEPVFTDQGRPGNCVYGQSMAVVNHKLYVGTCEPGATEAGHVFEYQGPGRWLDCGSPDKANSVTAMCSHQGKLYVGTGKYRLGGSALNESENPHLGGRIFRYDGERKWTPIGHFPLMEAVGGLVTFRGQLYVGSLYKPASFHVYDGTTWKDLPVPNGKRVEALGVYNGYLWATGYDEGHVYRYDGSGWLDLGNVGEAENTQTYAFATYQGQLQVATWRTGKVFALDNAKLPATPRDSTAPHDPALWVDRGRLGEELEVMGMLVHNGSLYAGTLPTAQLYRFDGGQKWSLLKQLDTTPDVKYRRVWTMAQFQGQLFATTLPSGHVWSLQTGAAVTWDEPFPAGRAHIAAQRQGDTLRLFVNGKRVAESQAGHASTLNLDIDHPWKIGAGSGDSFRGELGEVQVYKKALTAEEIQELASRR